MTSARPLVVQLNWHGRHSGVSTHVAAICGPLAAAHEVRWNGPLKPDSVSAITLSEVFSRAGKEPVVWHAHRNNDLLLGCLLRALGCQVKVVFTRHDSYPPGRFSKWVARWADVMITLNQENASWMGAPSVLIPHGVDTARFCPPASREQAWAALGVGGRNGIGVVGRVRENKGQADFAEAIAPLLPQFPDWRAALVGLVQEKDRAWAEGLRAKTAGALVLAGETLQVERWYQGLSVLVNPSHGESFGLTLVEGMASGCCVVASRLSHVPKLIEHGRTGFVYEPRDVTGLRELLQMLMREPEKAAEVGRHAAEEARARFGIERECAAIAQVYAGKLLPSSV